MLTKKFLGDEPAAGVAAIQVAVAAILALLVSLGVGLTQEASGVIMTVVTAVGTAVVGWSTVNTRLSLAVGIVKTVLVALVYFGALDLTDTQITLTVAALVAVADLFIRQTNSSADTPISNASPGSVRGDVSAAPVVAASPASRADRFPGLLEDPRESDAVG